MISIPMQRAYTLTATVVRVFDVNDRRSSFLIQNTGALNPCTISFDGTTATLQLAAGASLGTNTLPDGTADYKGVVYAWSALGTTILGVEVNL